jgi:hypothetical protein
MNTKLTAALKKGGTVSQLMKASKMSRGGVIQALRRNKKLIKKVGTKREHERGPESTIYALRSKPAKRAKTTPAQAEQALLAEVAELEAAGLTQEVAQQAIAKLDQAIAAEPIPVLELPPTREVTPEDPILCDESV